MIDVSLSDSPSVPKPPREGRRRRYGPILLGVAVVVAVLLASVTPVEPGSAAVVTRFGKPTRIVIEPGLLWHYPAPIERVRHVDVRLHSLSSGRYNIQVADGSILVAEAFLAWRVRQEPAAIARFVEAVSGDARRATEHLRGIVGSAMQAVSGAYRIEELFTTDQERQGLADFEAALRSDIDARIAEHYGIDIVDVGFERLQVPEALRDATIRAMVKEREVLAEQRRGEGLQRAGQILSEAESQARQAKAQARTAAAEAVATARQEAAALRAEAYRSDPQLYTLVRQLELLSAAMQSNSTVILRTDAAPLRLLVDGHEAGIWQESPTLPWPSIGAHSAAEQESDAGGAK